MKAKLTNFTKEVKSAMTKGKDREHFEDYREQTQIKHSILAAYLPAYYHILKGSNDNLIYIDGFAGPGAYVQTGTGDTFNGSPILALQLIADNKDFSTKVSTIFIEADEVLFDRLNRKVDEFYSTHPQIRKPICQHGAFADQLNEIVNGVGIYLAPTFLFVDPCGVSGTSFETIRAIMENPKCEAFIFFNIDGIRRIAGLPELSPVLVELMGTTARAKELYDKLRQTNNVGERERMILLEYCKALREEMGAKYIIPFRVEHEDRMTTSHYLIHASKHHLGFRIMKDVMWRRGHGEDEPGGLELRQRSRTDFVPLFDRHADIKAEILNALKARPLRVSLFYEEWTKRPDDMHCEAEYRQALLELESTGQIEVLSKDGKVVSVNMRRRPKGKATLGKDNSVRLKS
jgi:three-Cys-motif partner protein